MEVGGGLVILDPPDDGTVDDHLLVRVHFSAHDPEGVVGGVMVDLDAAEGLGTRAGRKPSLVAVIIKHHSGPAGTDDHLAAGREIREKFHIPHLDREGEWERDRDGGERDEQEQRASPGRQQGGKERPSWGVRQMAK